MQWTDHGDGKKKKQSTIRILEKKNEAPAMRNGVRLGALTPYFTLPYLVVENSASCQMKENHQFHLPFQFHRKPLLDI